MSMAAGTSLMDGIELTLVLVGRSGNGKSATGNSILGKAAFKSVKSSSAVTCTSQLESRSLRDGRVIRVVDTPGFFDAKVSQEANMSEVMKCLELTKDGIHALLLVLSTRNRYTAEELATLDILQLLFGNEVLKYVIVVFTGGDELEEEKITLEEHCAQAPDALKQLLDRCGSRTVVFNNKTRDESAKDRQAAQLLQIVVDMVRQNGGHAYTNELFQKAQELAMEGKQKLDAGPQGAAGSSSDQGVDMTLLRAELERAYAEQLHTIKVTMEEKLRITTERLEEKIAEEQRARQLMEERAYKPEKTTRELLLQQKLEEAQKQYEDLRRAQDRPDFLRFFDQCQKFAKFVFAL